MAEDYPRSIGQYEIVGRIGKGAMGQVFKAVQPSLNRVVAVKVLPPEMSKDPERIERFNREAQAVAMLNHPNVVHIIDKDQDGDLLFFVMEYVPGSSLDAVLRQRRLSLPETLKVFRGICRGLDAAHKQGITHRDLNPRNILVSEDLSTVKVADFGISRVQAISLLEGTLSTSALSLGTLHYMAPEQARDMTAVDQRSDIYSSGVVLYEMLTGRLPVGRFSLPSQLNSEVPPEIDPIVLKCLATNPEDRYPSVASLLTEVSRLEDHLRLGLVDELRGISRSTTKMFTRSTRSVARNRGVQIALGALLVLAIVGGGAYFVLRGRGEAPAAPPAAETPAPAAAEPSAPSQGAQEAPAATAEQSEPAAPVAEESAPPAAPAAPTPTAKPAAPAKAPAAKPEPPPSRPAAPAVDPAVQELQQAREQVAAHQSEAALATLGSLIERHPTSPATVDAYLLTGEIQEGAHQPAKAIATYQALRGRFPKDPRTAEGSFRLGKLELASGDKDRGDRRSAGAARRRHRLREDPVGGQGSGRGGGVRAGEGDVPVGRPARHLGAGGAGHPPPARRDLPRSAGGGEGVLGPRRPVRKGQALRPRRPGVQRPRQPLPADPLRRLVARRSALRSPARPERQGARRLQAGAGRLAARRRRQEADLQAEPLSSGRVSPRPSPARTARPGSRPGRPSRAPGWRAASPARGRPRARTQSSTGRSAGSPAVAACRRAAILRACSGWTRWSFSAAVSSTAGYFTPSFTFW